MSVARIPVHTDAAPEAVGPYSQAVRSGSLLFCSGQTPLDPASGAMVGATPGGQAAQCLRNLSAVAEAAGGSLADAVRLTVYMIDLGAFAEVNEVYAGFFSGAPPARAAVGVVALPKGAQVEIDAIVAMDPAG